MCTRIAYLVRLASMVILTCAYAAGDVSADEPVYRPVTPRVLHIPTAHLQPPFRIYVTAGGTHRGGAIASVATGLGRLAEIDAELTDHLAVCDGCSNPADKIAAESLIAASAQFKVGLREGQLAAWLPALALGYRKTFATREVDSFDDFTVARLYAAASKTLGPLRLHGGVDLWDASVSQEGGRSILSEQPFGDRVRPFAGLAWTPSIYPRTSLIADFSWIPVAEAGQADLRWLAGWGVQYQALDWASIELAVRHRQGDDLGDSTVLLRVNTVFPR